MNTRLRPLGYFLGALAIACGGKQVDLDSATPPVLASSDPAVLGTIQENALELEVDAKRIYWRASDGNGNVTLWGCDMQNCAVTATQFDQAVLEPFRASNGQVFWLAPGNQVAGAENGGVPVGAPTGNISLIAAVADATGAHPLWQGSPVDVAFSADTAFILQAEPGAMADANNQVVGEFDAVSLVDGTSRVVTTLGPTHDSLGSLVKGDYLYWLDRDQDEEQGTTQYGIARVRTDGSAPVETLVSGLPIVLQYDRRSTNRGLYVTNLVVDDNYVYWTHSALNGSLLRYPLNGGNGTPETILDSVRSPLHLLLEGSTLYFTYELDAFSYAVAKCEVDDCKRSAPITGRLEDPRVLASDDTSLYTVTSTEDLSVPAYAADGEIRAYSGQIRRFSE